MKTPERDNEGAVWAAFVAEAGALAALDPDEMSPAQVERLEALSDPFIHAFGYYDALRPSPEVFGDQRVVDFVVREFRGPRSLEREGRRLAEGRTRLRRRIVADLLAQDRGVRPERGLPVTRRRARTAIGHDTFAEAERAHDALVVAELAVAAGGGRALWDVECEEVLPLSPALPKGKYVALRISGDSMEPMMHSGDVVLVQLGAVPVRRRIIVAYHPDHGYLVKEVGRVTAGTIELRSLNEAYPVVILPLTPQTVLGTVVMRWCAHEV